MSLCFSIIEDEIIPLDELNVDRSRAATAAEPVEEEKPSEKSLRLCGVSKKTAIVARIILFVFIVIMITSLLLAIHKQQTGVDEELMEHHYLNKSAWTLKTMNVAQQNITMKLNNIPVRVYVNASSTQSCSIHSECIQLLQAIEMEPSILEVNFWISYDGTVFEDSGWTNSKRIFISFIGNETTYPSTESLKALEELLDGGVGKGKLDPNYKIIANKNFSLLSKEIQKSQHWNSLEEWLSV